MRLVTCVLSDGSTTIGVRVEDGIVATGYDDMLTLIEDGESALIAVRDATAAESRLDVERIVAPIANPRKMLFCGLNYRSHAEENPDAVFPDEPFFFSKVSSAIIGDGDPIVLPGPELKTDWEVELGVVIGKRARKVSAAKAMDHVFGYTIVNDVSARVIQFKDQQITLGKNLDTFCPMGPEIVLPDEIGELRNLGLRSFVNGELMQDASTSDMVFEIPMLIEFLSGLMTLEAGDLVSTGTPAGVGTFRSPPRYLAPGDEVVLEIDHIGRLENSVIAGW